MKFCQSCGNEILNPTILCVKCGNSLVHNENSVTVQPWTIGNMWTFGILAFFLPILGIIMGIIGLTKDVRRTQGIILLAVGIISFCFWLGFTNA